MLDEAIHKAPFVGLAVEESTDVSDNTQQLVYGRFFNEDKKEFCKDLLGVPTLQTSTRGEDIYNKRHASGERPTGRLTTPIWHNSTEL